MYMICAVAGALTGALISIEWAGGEGVSLGGWCPGAGCGSIRGSVRQVLVMRSGPSAMLPRFCLEMSPVSRVLFWG